MYQAKNTYPYSLTYVSGNVKTRVLFLLGAISPIEIVPLMLLTILLMYAIIEAWVLSTRKILGGVL